MKWKKIYLNTLDRTVFRLIGIWLQSELKSIGKLYTISDFTSSFGFCAVQSAKIKRWLKWWRCIFQEKKRIEWNISLPGVRKTFVVFFRFFHLARRFWNHTFFQLWIIKETWNRLYSKIINIFDYIRVLKCWNWFIGLNRSPKTQSHQFCSSNIVKIAYRVEAYNGLTLTGLQMIHTNRYIYVYCLFLFVFYP